MMNFKSLQKPLVLLFLLCLLPMGAWAQGVVKGIVNDEAGEPIWMVSSRLMQLPTLS